MSGNSQSFQTRFSDPLTNQPQDELHANTRGYLEYLLAGREREGVHHDTFPKPQKRHQVK